MNPIGAERVGGSTGTRRRQPFAGISALLLVACSAAGGADSPAAVGSSSAVAASYSASSAALPSSTSEAPPAPALTASSQASAAETSAATTSSDVPDGSPTVVFTVGAPTATTPTSVAVSSAAASATAMASLSSSADTTASPPDSGAPGGCTRDLLQTTLDAYLEALPTHDPSTLPLAGNVKFTENGKSSKLGEAGLWKTAGMVKYSQSALDTESCSTASHVVVPDGAQDIPVGLRLKLEGGKLIEVEMIAVRSGDYSVASDPAALIQKNDTVEWEKPVSAAERDTRETLMGWMDRYFRVFPSGVCNTDSNCVRLENGGGNFSCSLGATCSMGAPSGTPKLNPRLILADEERGIGIGFTMFTGGYTDMHMFKMYGGKVYAVHAMLAKAADAGWE